MTENTISKSNISEEYLTNENNSEQNISADNIRQDFIAEDNITETNIADYKVAERNIIEESINEATLHSEVCDTGVDTFEQDANVRRKDSLLCFSLQKTFRSETEKNKQPKLRQIVRRRKNNVNFRKLSLDTTIPSPLLAVTEIEDETKTSKKKSSFKRSFKKTFRYSNILC